jgi:hypothetical protein
MIPTWSKMFTALFFGGLLMVMIAFEVDENN